MVHVEGKLREKSAHIKFCLEVCIYHLFGQIWELVFVCVWGVAEYDAYDMHYCPRKKKAGHCVLSHSLSDGVSDSSWSYISGSHLLSFGPCLIYVTVQHQY